MRCIKVFFKEKGKTLGQLHRDLEPQLHDQDPVPRRWLHFLAGGRGRWAGLGDSVARGKVSWGQQAPWGPPGDSATLRVARAPGRVLPHVRHSQGTRPRPPARAWEGWWRVTGRWRCRTGTGDGCTGGGWQGTLPLGCRDLRPPGAMHVGLMKATDEDSSQGKSSGDKGVGRAPANGSSGARCRRMPRRTRRRRPGV